MKLKTFRTDINVDQTTTIPSQPCAYISGENNDQSASQSGTVVFDYVPPHPPLSNPKKQHRYLLSLWKQSKDLEIDIQQWKAIAQAEREKAKLLEPHHRIVEGNGETKMNFRERMIPFPSLKFAQSFGLELGGYGFFTSSFTSKTPEIFQSLG